MSNTPNKTKSEKDILADLLANLPDVNEVEVDLPSKNRFYTLKDPSKPIMVRPMTFKDEKALLSGKNNVNVVNVLLSRCVSNIDIGSILLIDKLVLIMKIREISYGDSYSASVTCPSCRNDNTLSIKVSELGITDIPDQLQDPCLVRLGVLKKDAKVKFPRIKDEEFLINPEVTSANFWRFITEIEGYKSKTIITKVAENLPIKDAHAVLDVLNGTGLGLNTKVKFVCDFCPNTEVMELPIGPDFFTGN